ncbi:MAG TPA: winged helix-turn-helix domain-containing protein [Acidobacteriota bacterium]|nr:winged helix-turn-helix domain-containing protein [Acidobacteriota bacterium]
MKRKRDRLEVIYDILSTISAKSGTIKPTHILYKSNLSHSMMEEYMEELLEKGFIEQAEHKGSRTYVITPKGLEYLQKYKFIKEFVESFGLN